MLSGLFLLGVVVLNITYCLHIMCRIMDTLLYTILIRLTFKVGVGAWSTRAHVVQPEQDTCISQSDTLKHDPPPTGCCSWGCSLVRPTALASRSSWWCRRWHMVSISNTGRKNLRFFCFKIRWILVYSVLKTPSGNSIILSELLNIETRSLSGLSLVNKLFFLMKMYPLDQNSRSSLKN